MARDHHASRGMRDEASVGPDPRRARQLKRLSELKFRVADGEPDIVGWTVFASTGREVGRVTDLLVDVEAGEVVMLDIDLRRDDRHSLAPLRAAWIDHAAKRVVLDARELEAHAPDELLPGLPRSGAISDDDMTRFNDGYVRAYGDRGIDRDAEWRVRRGEEDLHFGAAPRADLGAAPRRDDRGLPGAGAAAAAGAAGALPAPHFDESRRIDHIMEGQPTARPADRHDDRQDDRYDDRNAPRRLLDPADPRAAAPLDRDMGRDASRDLDRPDRGDRVVDRDVSPAAERRLLSTDDASALHPSGAIDPRELDGRVRIEEGATVDDRAPVGGVRYEGGAAPSGGYGRPDERYGPEYGSGRIGMDRVVSRHPRGGDRDPADYDPSDAARRLDEAGDRTLERRTPDDRLAAERMADDPRVVRYRRYEDAPPNDLRR